MVNLHDELVGLSNGTLLEIKSWEVQFNTPWGLCKTIKEAKELIMRQMGDIEDEQDKINVENIIKPVCVAICTGYQEVVQR